MRQVAIEQALDVVRKRWKGAVLLILKDGPLRFRALQRSVPPVSHQVLIRVLRELECDGILLRNARPGPRKHVEYALTERGHSLASILSELAEWSQQSNAPSGA